MRCNWKALRLVEFTRGKLKRSLSSFYLTFRNYKNGNVQSRITQTANGTQTICVSGFSC
jgi:hypothetical protein